MEVKKFIGRLRVFIEIRYNSIIFPVATEQSDRSIRANIVQFLVKHDIRPLQSCHIENPFLHSFPNVKAYTHIQVQRVWLRADRARRR